MRTGGCTKTKGPHNAKKRLLTCKTVQTREINGLQTVKAGEIESQKADWVKLQTSDAGNGGSK